MTLKLSGKTTMLQKYIQGIADSIGANVPLISL